MLKMSPYIVLTGRASEALDFYQSIFGGTVDKMPHSTFNPDPSLAGQLMHGQLDTDGFTLMCADDPRGGETRATGNTSICLWGGDAETGRRWFEALAEGGTVNTAFATQMWGDSYGDLVDKFGVEWAVNVSGGS